MIQSSKTLLTAALVCIGSLQAYADEAMKIVSLNAGLHVIQAEVANTFATRALGLMHRKAMGTNRGMLFVFPAAERQCMWMRNTLLPLSVAFMDEQGAIINIEDMHPQTETSHCALGAARYALEMNKGWFASRGIKPGSKVSGLDRAPDPQ